MTVRLIAAASVWTVRSESTPMSATARAAAAAANAGSPSQPSVSEASVMPSWLADR